MLPTVIVPLQNFNSIKVRLEQPLQEHDRDRIRFQFHKGTIRTWCSMRSTTLTIYFNSIKVRLELYLPDAKACDNGNFNSIKVRLEPPVNSGALAVPPFQFHKGTIRTSNNQGNINVDFNNFNSIKVRLEQSYYLSPESIKDLFQFHKGTIRTSIGTVLRYHGVISIP